MKIEILGTGCAKCQKLEELVREVINTSGVEADVVNIKDIKQIMSCGVMTTPCLVIDGQVKITREMPTADQIESWIKG